MKVEWVPASQVVELSRVPIELDDAAIYQQVGVRGFGRGIFSYDPVPGHQLGHMRYFHLAPNMLVVSNIKGWEGAVDVTGADESGRIISNRFLTYRSKGVNLSYLRHWLLSEPGLRLLGQASPGSADRNRTLSIANFERIRVPLPSRPDQDRIAAHLSSLGRSGPAMPSHQVTTVERLVARATASAPRRRLGEVLLSSRQWLDVDVAASYRPIGVRGFGRGMIRYPEVPAESLSKLRYYPVEPGALIVSNIKAWEGAVCMAEPTDAGRIASNRFLQYLPTSKEVTTRWVEQYLLSAEGIASLASASPGSADRNRTLSMAAFESIDIPVPEVQVQHSVANIAHAFRRVQSQQAHRDRLATAILPAARNEIFSAMR